MDVARFAVRVLEDEAAFDATLELGGPEALSPLDVVRICEEETKRELQVHHVPAADLRARYEASEDSMEKAFAALMLAIAAGDPIPMEETLARFPLELTSVREYARRFV